RAGGAGAGGGVRARLGAGGGGPVAAFGAAAAAGRRVGAGSARLFDRCDVLLTPVGAGQPFPGAAESGLHLGEEISFRDLVMPFTTPQDLCGLPACTVRAGLDPDGIPVGIQFTGRPWAEAIVLRAAQGLFDATPELQAVRPALT